MKKMMNLKIREYGLIGTASAVVLGISLAFPACGTIGTSPIVSLVNNVKAKTYLQGTDQWAQITADLSSGGFQMAGINLPIADPQDPSKVYGQMTLNPVLCGNNPSCTGGGELTLAVNITQSSQTSGVQPILPNGTAIPVGGLQNTQVIALPIASTGALMYLGFGPGAAMLGTAIPFSALDPAGHYTPGVNIFQPLTFGPVNVIAGIFAGAAPNTTGFGLFADLSGVINQAPASIASAVVGNGSSAIPQSSLIMTPVKPAPEVEREIYLKIYELSQGRGVLKLQ